MNITPKGTYFVVESGESFESWDKGMGKTYEDWDDEPEITVPFDFLLEFKELVTKAVYGDPNDPSTLTVKELAYNNYSNKHIELAKQYPQYLDDEGVFQRALEMAKWVRERVSSAANIAIHPEYNFSGTDDLGDFSYDIGFGYMIGSQSIDFHLPYLHGICDKERITVGSSFKADMNLKAKKKGGLLNGSIFTIRETRGELVRIPDDLEGVTQKYFRIADYYAGSNSEEQAYLATAEEIAKANGCQVIYEQTPETDEKIENYLNRGYQIFDFDRQTIALKNLNGHIYTPSFSEGKEPKKIREKHR